MAIDLELAPKTKRPPGEPCCEPVVYPARRDATIAPGAAPVQGAAAAALVGTLWWGR